MTKTSTVSLTEGSIPKGLIAFAIPIFLGNLFQQLYNVADSLIVGNFVGSEGLAAVTSTDSLIFLLVGFFNGMAIGAGVVISTYFGAKDYKNVRAAIHTTVAFGLICGVVLTFLGVTLTPMILSLMGTPSDVLYGATGYLRVYFAGSLFVVMYNVCTGILQAMGDSRHPLYYLIISSIINVALDLIFCGALGLGVEFAALATILAQFLSVLLCLNQLMRMEGLFRLNWREVAIRRNMLKQIIHMGLPMGLQNSIISLANVVVQSNINVFGKMAMAGCGSYAKIEGFAFLPITCFSMALTTFVGQNKGAKRLDRVKKGSLFGIACSLALAELVGIVMYIFIPQLITLFNRNPEVVEFGTLRARGVTLFYFLLAFSHVAAGILRGAGKSVVPMFVMLGSWCVFRICYVTAVAKIFEDIRVVFSAYPITWTISTVIFIVYMLKSNWLGEKPLVQ